MPKFQHKVVNLSSLEKGLSESLLLGLGQEGWELVSVDNLTAYLKKEELPPAMQMPTLTYAPATAVAPATPGDPSSDSPRHWLPNTLAGEQRKEFKTSQESGLKSAAHSHNAYVIIKSDKSVVRGKTDNVLGHEHDIKVLGTTEESDGHAHGMVDYPQ